MGQLVEAMSPPKTMLPSILSRIKILANLDIAIRMEPQDGKFQIRFEGRAVDFRLSTLPVVGGEKAVMRILDQSNVASSLGRVGVRAEVPRGLQARRHRFRLRHGPGDRAHRLRQVDDPATRPCTRSRHPEINVVTVEDPVEYRIDGVNQVPVNPKRGLTFAGALRSILRQDPDVVLVGEIRDTETAEIAVKAALTGHLVLSTLHTNDAVGAVTRLVDMGVDPFMVSSSLLCVGCPATGSRPVPALQAIETELPEKELLAVGMRETEFDDLQLHGPNTKGCPRCKAGYRGTDGLARDPFAHLGAQAHGGRGSSRTRNQGRRHLVRGC